MASENGKSAQHSLRIPHDLMAWLRKKQKTPSESLSLAIINLLWERKAADESAAARKKAKAKSKK